MNKTPILYILMRADMASMNSGKAIAQGSHAPFAFIENFESVMQAEVNSVSDEAAELNNAYYLWKNSTTQGFGNTLVLGADIRQIRNVVEEAKSKSYLADIIHDPTYPLVDGEVVHFIPVDTCAYVFVPDKDTHDIHSMRLLSLHP